MKLKNFTLCLLSLLVLVFAESNAQSFGRNFSMIARAKVQAQSEHPHYLANRVKNARKTKRAKKQQEKSGNEEDRIREKIRKLSS